MKTIILKSWKTSLFGVLAAIPQLHAAYTTGGKYALVGGVATLLLGLFSKDGNVSSEK